MAASQPPLSDETLQRVLYIATKVHVYTIPPLKSTKGYQASTWTNPTPGDPNPAREIFTARLRVLETAIPVTDPDAGRTAKGQGMVDGEKLTVSILLEDPATGDLFAEAPYTQQSVVEPAVDSSRFYAVRVVGPGGGGAAMTAILGIGFEDRAESMEFGICLQGCGKVLGITNSGVVGKAGAASGTGASGASRGKAAAESGQAVKRDWSLKQGESIKVEVGLKSRRKETEEGVITGNAGGGPTNALFSIKPPPAPTFLDRGNGKDSRDAGSEGSIPLLAPPPGAPSSRTEKRRSRDFATKPPATQVKSHAEELGFDDGEFGEFQ